MLENEHTSQLYADIQRFSTLGFHYKAFVRVMAIFTVFSVCDINILFPHVMLSCLLTYYLFIPPTINRYPCGTSRMRYMKLISFLHVAVHSLVPKWKKACCEFVCLTLCFKIVNPLSIIDRLCLS